MPQTNKWLRWALVEAAWVAVRLDPYFRTHFANRRAYKRAQSAIVATARRLLEVVWHVLKEDLPCPRRAASRFPSIRPQFELRGPLHRLTGGIDLSQIDGIGPQAALHRLVIGTDMTR